MAAAAAQYAWAQQMQQQAQMMQANSAAAAAAAAGGCTGSNAAAAAGPAPLRHCQALANGLPFLPQGNAAAAGQFCCPPVAAMGGACGSNAPIAATPGSSAAAAAAMAAMPGCNPLMGLDLSAMAAMQQQQSAAAAAAGDSMSVAESGSASDSGLHLQSAAAAAAAMQRAGSSLNPLMMPNAAAAAAAAAAETPSTFGPQGGLPPPGFGDAAAAAAAGDSAAAAAAVTIGDGCDGDGDTKMVCQVPGCGKDLTHLKDYHQRYRICATHIKLPQVMRVVGRWARGGGGVLSVFWRWWRWRRRWWWWLWWWWWCVCIAGTAGFAVRRPSCQGGGCAAFRPGFMPHRPCPGPSRHTTSWVFLGGCLHTHGTGGPGWWTALPVVNAAPHMSLAYLDAALARGACTRITRVHTLMPTPPPSFSHFLPQVMKDGRLQRFCQQCGRFHDLSAFDGNRKSCREQLQKHNARRWA